MKNTAGNLLIVPHPKFDRVFGDIHISTVPQCRNQNVELSETTDKQKSRGIMEMILVCHVP